MHFSKKRVWARVILESGYCKSHVLHERERVVFVTDRNKVLTTNGRMQFWLPKMEETASFEIWWWRWQCHSFRTETIIILSLTLYTKYMECVTDKWFKLSEPLLLYKQHPRRWARHTSILLLCIAIISLSLSEPKQKMVGTDLRQQLSNYIQSMRDQVSSDQTQFFVLMR